MKKCSHELWRTVNSSFIEFLIDLDVNKNGIPCLADIVQENYSFCIFVAN